MQIIGEKINGKRKSVAQAIEQRNTETIQNLAIKQAEAGAHWLDINAGTPPDQEEWHIGVEKAGRAIAVYRDLNEVRQLAETLHVSTRLHLAQGELKPALETSTEIMHLLDTTPALPKPHEYRYTHAQVLRTLGREAEVNEHLQLAYEWVMHVAEKLTDAALRQSWLENVRINREIVRQWIELGH